MAFANHHDTHDKLNLGQLPSHTQQYELTALIPLEARYYSAAGFLQW